MEETDEPFRRQVKMSLRQKKKLIDFVSKHPELISGRVTKDYNYKYYRRLWHRVAIECNSLPGPGARKDWRQWRKTWQDMHSKAKKRQSLGDDEIPSAEIMLTQTEQEALAKNVSSTTNYQDTSEFVVLKQDEESIDIEDDNPLEVSNDMELSGYSDPGSPSDTKEFLEQKVQVKIKNRTSDSGHDTGSCNFNCEQLAASEKKKLKIKEDYLNFRKEYLNKKLQLMEDHNEALRSIAKELSNVTANVGVSSSTSPRVTLKLPNNLLTPKIVVPVVTRKSGPYK